MTLEEIAKYAFIAFAVIAIVMGLVVGFMAFDGQDVVEIHGYITLVMLILGVIVGLVSVTSKEVTPFLIAAIALIVVGVASDVWGPLNQDPLELLYYWATYIVAYFAAFAAPAAVLISAKSIWDIAKEK